jgi:hypothetical protein
MDKTHLINYLQPQLVPFTFFIEKSNVKHCLSQFLPIRVEHFFQTVFFIYIFHLKTKAPSKAKIAHVVLGGQVLLVDNHFWQLQHRVVTASLFFITAAKNQSIGKHQTFIHLGFRLLVP